MKRHHHVLVAFILVSLVGLAVTASAAPPKPKDPRRIDLSLTEEGWKPKEVKVKKDEDVKLVFTRKTDRTCAKEVILYTSDKDKIEKKLPLNEPVEIVTRFRKAGELGFTCHMNMVSGVIHVQ